MSDIMLCKVYTGYDVYVRSYEDDYGTNKIQLDIERGEKLAELWYKNKRKMYKIDGSIYRASDILQVVKRIERKTIDTSEQSKYNVVEIIGYAKN